MQERKLGRIVSVHGPRGADAALLAGAATRPNGSQSLARAARGPASAAAVERRGMRFKQNAVDRVGNRQRQNLAPGSPVRARTKLAVVRVMGARRHVAILKRVAQ